MTVETRRINSYAVVHSVRRMNLWSAATPEACRTYFIRSTLAKTRMYAWSVRKLWIATSPGSNNPENSSTPILHLLSYECSQQNDFKNTYPNLGTFLMDSPLYLPFGLFWKVSPLYLNSCVLYRICEKQMTVIVLNWWNSRNVTYLHSQGSIDMCEASGKVRFTLRSRWWHPFQWIE